jgi:site-specific DNA-methyltransferase (adenine-specific)
MPDPLYLPDLSAIYLGDAFKLIKMVVPGSVRLILTDPPYNVSQANNLHTMGRRGIDFGEWDREFDQTGWLEDAVKALMPRGSMIIWNDWKLLGFISAHLQSLGMDVKRQMRWVKNNPIPRNMLRVPVQADECCLWAVKPPKGKWVFNKRKTISYERGEFHHPVISHAHPNKKPGPIFKDIIEIFSNEGDLVLDPFAGGGTTAAAAHLAGRKHISFENKPDYFELAIEELAKVTTVTRFKGFTDGGCLAI